MAYRVYRKRLWDYFLPFFLLIAFVAVVILGVRLFHAIQTNHDPLDVYLYTVSGKTRMLPWGTNEWQPALNESRLLQGDQVKTLTESRSAVRFFDSLWMRLDSQSDVAFQSVEHSNDRDDLSIFLQKGSAWFSTNPVRERDLFLEVYTGRLRVRNQGTIFSATHDKNETIRVIKGEVSIDILEPDGDDMRTIETVSLGTGEEFVLTDELYRLFVERKNPPASHFFSSAFVSSEWFSWNNHFDSAPESLIDHAISTVAAAQPSSEDLTPPESPAIMKPALSERSITGDAVIEGTVDADTVKVTVTTYETGKPSPYILRKFQKGDSSFRYMVSAKYGNLKAGENLFSFVAEDEAGNQSPPAEVKIFYQPKEVLSPMRTE